MQADETTKVETKRDRVRRLLLTPLGFRFPKGTDEDHQRKVMDRLADDLGYLTDFGLTALRDMLRSKGEGSARNFWPDHATFIGFAECVQPRPIEELPALLSWFGSVEGPKAIAEGTLVETYEFVARRKVPPYTPQMRAMVAEHAERSKRRLAIVSERRAADLPIGPDDLAWERWYLDRRALCEGLVERERARKAGAA